MESGSVVNVNAKKQISFQKGTWIKAGARFHGKIEASSFSCSLLTTPMSRHALNQIEANSILGLDDNMLSSANSDFQIYPNPSSGKVTIEGACSSIPEVEITDMSGKKVNVEVLETLTSDSYFKATFNLRMLPSGSYFIKLLKCEKPLNKLFILSH